jgi:TetR/AcrR family transcriptional repressor of nem operon
MDNRKEQIVSLALELIRKKGYVAISYDDISKKLGVTKASIHYHFEKKEDLAIALTGKLHKSLERLVLSTKDVSMPVEEKINQFITKQFELGGDAICPLSSLQTDYESLPEAVQLRVRVLSQFEFTSWVDVLTEAQKEGIVNSYVNTESLAYAVLSCIKGGMQYNRVLSKNIIPQVVDQINRLIRC